MKILHVLTEGKKNILNRPVENLVKGLDFNGISSEICILDLQTKFQSVLKKSNADIVHFHCTDAFKGCLISARMAGKKTVYTSHVVDNSLSRFDRLWINAIVANSNFVNNATLRARGKVVFDGIDLEDFDARMRGVDVSKLRAELGIADDVFIIGAIGPLIRENDYETLIKALRNVVVKEMNAIVLIAGEGELEAELKKKAAELGVSERLKFTGLLDYVSLFCLFDAYVISSYVESYMGSILGAMAASKPVIATKIGANPEMIYQGKAGFLVPCGFPERIDNIIMRWKANPQHTKDIGLASRAQVEEVFSVDVMGRKYKEIYESL